VTDSDVKRYLPSWFSIRKLLCWFEPVAGFPELRREGRV
jgi:hypothetical protein